ncbi:SAM-dependent methyltransferase [Nonomuraea salmonea]|uniref:SAM-dependent methyltransferase n=1 Tax=Nonomuraea salmonea TaxID=46181 RepID=UPI002FE80B9B
MSLRFHEIAGSRNQILNPLTDDKLRLLGEICGFTPGTRILDLACGKGELLSRWAAEYAIEGLGVDISKVFLDAAKKTARKNCLSPTGSTSWRPTRVRTWTFPTRTTSCPASAPPGSAAASRARCP